MIRQDNDFDKHALWIFNPQIVSSCILTEAKLQTAPSCQATNFLSLSFSIIRSRRLGYVFPFFCFVNCFLYLSPVYGPPTTSASPSTHVSLTSLMLVQQVLFVTLCSSCVSRHFSLLFFILSCYFKVRVRTNSFRALNIR